MSRRPTVYDVAARAGVSIATVSFAFRRPERVRDTTRATVLAAARALGYVPSVNASGLARGRTGALGLYALDYLLPDGTGADDDPRAFPLYADEVQRGVALQCRRRGYALMLAAAPRDTTGQERAVTDIAGRVDGLAVLPHTLPPDTLRRVASRLPVVAVSEPGRPHRDDRMDHVTVHNAAGTAALTHHLLSRHGRRDLLFTGCLEAPDNRARLDGFHAALRAAGLRPPRPPATHRGDGAGHARALVRDLAGRDALPEAFVCATDQDALAVLDALAGVAPVPDRVAVTGFDGILAGRLATPALTTVRQPMADLGRTAVEVLLDRLARPDRPPAHRQLPVRLTVRRSCGCRPGR